MDKNTLSLSLGQSIIETFSPLKDPRARGKSSHRLIDIIVISICAIICGARHWNQIAEFGRQRESWLKQFIQLPNGIPSHQTFCRVLGLIAPEELMKCFMSWSCKTTPLSPNDIIAIDGKTVRGSGHKANNRGPLHLINAYVVDRNVTLGAVKTPDKSNEIKGIPLLLKSLAIKDCIITIDAMGTQKGIAKLIRLKGAHYVLALKGNQGKLHRLVKDLFTKIATTELKTMVYRQHQTSDYGHHRIETRKYTVLPLMYLQPYIRPDWLDLETFIEVESRREMLNGDIEVEKRYYISSLPLNQYQRASLATRSHWQVENKLHWKLDVSMQEDSCPIYHPRASENFSTLRKLVLQLLEKEQSSSQGIPFKQWKAALNNDYLQKVVGF